MILALDVGFVATGWSVFAPGLVACGCIRTERSAKKRGIRVADDDAERCGVLARGLRELLRVGYPQVLGVVAELPTGGAQGARANRAMGMATGVVVATVEDCGVGAEWVAPDAVKQAATGRRNASKDEMIRLALKRWPAIGRWCPEGRVVCDAGTPAWALEHIADACWAFEAARNGALVRAVFSEARK